MVRPKPLRAAFTIFATVALGSGFAVGMARAAGPGFLSHQALYELSLVKSRGSNAVNGARGRILYNFSGSACEGYTSEFRQVSELNSGEGKLTLSDLRSTSWEDAEGKSYRFKIDTRMNDSESPPVDGMAERVGERIVVEHAAPHTPDAIGLEVDQLREMLQRRVRQVVDHADGGPKRQQGVDQVPADEPGAAGHDPGAQARRLEEKAEEVIFETKLSRPAVPAATRPAPAASRERP